MISKSVSHRTDSDYETINLGRELGASLKSGDVIALVGELGSGKTCFAKGLALGLDVDPETVVTSPSFALLNEYSGRYPFYHIDCYRLEKLEDFLLAGLEEYFYGEGVVAIEWADRWPDTLPSRSIWVDITIVDEQCRRIKFTGKHDHSVKIIDNILNSKS